MNLFERMWILFDKINSLFLWFVSILLAAGWLAVCYEVFIRYFFNKSTTWSLELNENVLVFITYLGAAWVLKRNGHVRIDLVVRWLPEKAESIVNCISSILCAAACLVITWYGAQVVLDQYRFDYHDASILDLPQWPLCIVLPIGFLMLFIQFIRKARGSLKHT